MSHNPSSKKDNALFTPGQYLQQYVQTVGGFDRIVNLPEDAVVFFRGEDFSLALSLCHAEAMNFSPSRPSPYSILRRDDATASAFLLDIGAPRLLKRMREIAALGAKRFYLVGDCLGLSSTLSIGDIVIADRVCASMSYIASLLGKETIAASASLVHIFDEIFAAQSKCPVHGLVCSIDDLYAETSDFIHTLQAAGTIALDMEAATAYYLSGILGVDTIALFVVSEVVVDGTWRAGKFSIPERQGHQSLVEVAMQAALRNGEKPIKATRNKTK